MEGNIKVIEDIIDSIIKNLSPFRETQNGYAGIAIWTDEAVLVSNLQSNGFIDRLKVALDNKDLRDFSKDIKIAVPQTSSEPQKVSISTTYGDLSVFLLPLLPTISAIIGTLESEKYILDWKKRKRWNIGRGFRPSSAYRVYEDNFVIIRNDEQDPHVRNINEHVSSFHAAISYENGQFYLSAETGGIDITKLVRRELDITFRAGLSVPLEDGDMIKLGSSNHYVMLRFSLS